MAQKGDVNDHAVGGRIQGKQRNFSFLLWEHGVPNHANQGLFLMRARTCTETDMIHASFVFAEDGSESSRPVPGTGTPATAVGGNGFIFLIFLTWQGHTPVQEPASPSPNRYHMSDTRTWCVCVCVCVCVTTGRGTHDSRGFYEHKGGMYHVRFYANALVLALMV